MTQFKIEIFNLIKLKQYIFTFYLIFMPPNVDQVKLCWHNYIAQRLINGKLIYR